MGTSKIMVRFNIDKWKALVACKVNYKIKFTFNLQVFIIIVEGVFDFLVFLIFFFTFNQSLFINWITNYWTLNDFFFLKHSTGKYLI